MTTKWVWAVALLAAGTVAPASWAQNPAPRARAATVVVAGGGSYLGVGVLDVDAERAKALKLKEDRGVEISSVTEGGPADKAGIKRGDVVLEYNGEAVEGMTQFQRLVHETPAGREVKIQVWRNGAPLTLAATVGARKGLSLEGPDADIEMFNNEPPFTMSLPPMQPFDMPHILTLMPSRRLGIEGESLGDEPQFAEFLGVKEGVLVKSVAKNSAADKAGIKAGDVITKIGDTPVVSSRDITDTLRSNRQKQTFTVTVMRSKKEMQIPVTIEERTGQNAMRAAADC
ncbi:MAG: PDZ domain-containing protein [Bryobacteraceae bacterium]